MFEKEIMLQRKIKLYKDQLKENPNCIATKKMLAYNRAELMELKDLK